MALLVTRIQYPLPEAFELNKEDHEERRAEINKAFEEVGGRHIARAATDLGGRIFINEFPNYEAYMEYRNRLAGLRYFQLFHVETYMGNLLPPRE